MEISRRALSRLPAARACVATLHSAGMKPRDRRRRVSGWRATPRREYIERELAGEIAAVSALQSDNPGERDDLSRVRSQPQIRFTAKAESAAQFLSASRG